MYLDILAKNLHFKSKRVFWNNKMQNVMLCFCPLCAITTTPTADNRTTGMIARKVSGTCCGRCTWSHALNIMPLPNPN